MKPSDKLTNYYCYNKENGEYNSISLIGKIDLKNCYNSCKTCNLDQVGISSYHHCNKCNNDYYPFYEITNSNEENFNCYLKNSSEVSRAYFSELNQAFYYCDESCKSCENENNCLTCNDQYFFKANNNNILLYDEYCFNKLPERHFFDENANILNKKNETIKSVFKPCYEKCLTCRTNGTLEQNNCDECLGNLIKYKFKEGQCLINTSVCTEVENFWKIENNNITCVEKCNSSIISEGINKGQCINDCKNYLNPFIYIGEKDTNYLTLKCDNETYCISYEHCNEIGFSPSRDGSECIGFCNDFNIFEFENIVDYINSLPVPNKTKANMTLEEIFTELKAHMIKGLMVHNQMVCYYEFL